MLRRRCRRDVFWTLSVGSESTVLLALPTTHPDVDPANQEMSGSALPESLIYVTNPVFNFCELSLPASWAEFATQLLWAIMRLTISYVILLNLMLGGCAAQYGPLGIGGGYIEKPLDSTT